MSKLLTKSVDGKILYAIAEERWTGRLWVPNGITNVHAIDQANARFIYLQTKEKDCRYVAIAPVIGYHVEDSHGERLRA
jgi:hypothetical protein